MKNESFDPDNSANKFDDLICKIVELSSTLPRSKQFEIYDALAELRGEYYRINSECTMAQLKVEKYERRYSAKIYKYGG